MIRVLLHQLERPLQPHLVHESDREATLPYELAQPVGAIAPWREHMKCLCQHRHCGVQRFLQSTEYLAAVAVLGIVRVKEGDQRSRID
jgi:hypothetical protein